MPMGVRNSSSSTSPGWMLGRFFMGGSLASVAIDDLHVVGVTIGPSETDAPLVVDPDAVLAIAAALQGFEPVCRGSARIIQHSGIAEHAQLATRHELDIRRQAPGWRSAPDLFRFPVGKVPDHGSTITPTVI